MLSRRSLLKLAPASALPLVLLPRPKDLDVNLPNKLRLYADLFETKGRGCFTYVELKSGRRVRSQIKSIEASNDGLVFKTEYIAKYRDVATASVIMSRYGDLISAVKFSSDVNIWIYPEDTLKTTHTIRVTS